RRARLRILWGNTRGGSSPLSRTKTSPPEFSADGFKPRSSAFLSSLAIISFWRMPHFRGCVRCAQDFRILASFEGGQKRAQFRDKSSRRFECPEGQSSAGQLRRDGQPDGIFHWQFSFSHVIAVLAVPAAAGCFATIRPAPFMNRTRSNQKTRKASGRMVKTRYTRIVKKLNGRNRAIPMEESNLSGRFPPPKKNDPDAINNPKHILHK